MKRTIAVALAALPIIGGMATHALAGQAPAYSIQAQAEQQPQIEQTSIRLEMAARYLLQGEVYRSIDVVESQFIELDAASLGSGAQGTVELTGEVSRTVATRNGTVTAHATYHAAISDEVVDLVNVQRTQAGKAALQFDPDLAEAALQRAMETTVSWSHTRPDGSQWHTVCTTANGENIAKGNAFQTAQSVMAAWMNSPGHKQNILRDDFTRIGVAAVKIGDTVYWVQLFGK